MKKKLIKRINSLPKKKKKNRRNVIRRLSLMKKYSRICQIFFQTKLVSGALVIEIVAWML